MSNFSVPKSCLCYAAKTPAGPFESFSITRRACGPNDVVIEIKYAGICHSDIHQVNQDWGPAIFPMVPGHEIGRLPYYQVYFINYSNVVIFKVVTLCRLVPR